MVFSSMIFLCIFLPLIFGLHLVIPGMRAKNFLLTVGSLLFYAYGEPVYVVLLLLSSFFNYLLAYLIGREKKEKKGLLVLAVVLNLALLIVFKYAGFLIESLNYLPGVSLPVPVLTLPIGISFFTFQAMSYVIDVYRGVTKPQKNFGKVLLYISFFPQLIAGPIVKYHDIALEIENRTISLEETSAGIRRFIAGLCKKVLIANTMGMVADTLFGASKLQINGAGAWLGAISYMFQIYFDFSGYSDMAIGLGRMFGFHFRENFSYPYISGSIREFWQRWHISLSGWFREYLYIPLGGNRKGKAKTVRNKMIVFLLTGLWHGATWNFVFWGAYHGFFLMLEEYLPFIRREGGKIKSILQHLYTLLTVCIGFVFFRADTMGQGIFWLKRMFTSFNWDQAAMSLMLQQLTPIYLITAVVAVIASTPVFSRWKNSNSNSNSNGIALDVVSICGFVLCVLSLAGGTYNPFIYFRF